MLPTHHLKKGAAVALALGAIAPAAATASPVGPDPSGATYQPPPTTTVVHIISPTSSFDWTDAGIGAAGGLALSILGLGTAFALTDRRARHANRPAAPTH